MPVPTSTKLLAVGWASVGLLLSVYPGNLSFQLPMIRAALRAARG